MPWRVRSKANVEKGKVLAQSDFEVNAALSSSDGSYSWHEPGGKWQQLYLKEKTTKSCGRTVRKDSVSDRASEQKVCISESGDPRGCFRSKLRIRLIPFYFGFNIRLTCSGSRAIRVLKSITSGKNHCYMLIF